MVEKKRLLGLYSKLVHFMTVKEISIIEKVSRGEGRSDSVETEEIVNWNDKKRLQTKSGSVWEIRESLWQEDYLPGNSKGLPTDSS